MFGTIFSKLGSIFFITKKVEFGFITTKRRGKNTWANSFYEAHFQYSIGDNILKEKMQDLVLICFFQNITSKPEQTFSFNLRVFSWPGGNEH